jgi:hypothetical protein
MHLLSTYNLKHLRNEIKSAGILAVSVLPESSHQLYIELLKQIAAPPCNIVKSLM